MQTNDHSFISVYTDGGARGNPGPAATGFVVKSTTKTLHKAGLYIGEKTNNQAEYQAVIEALKWLSQNNKQLLKEAKSIQFRLDSLLVVNQLNGKFKIKNLGLRELLLQIRNIEPDVTLPISYAHIPRAQNAEADSLVNDALDKIDKLSSTGKLSST